MEVNLWRIKNKVNLENIADYVKDIDSKIKNVEEKELDSKSPEEQQKLKEQWEKEKFIKDFNYRLNSENN